MSQLATIHSSKAVCLVGHDQEAQIQNAGQATLYLGGGTVSAENHEQQLAPGESVVVTGPVFATAAESVPVAVREIPAVEPEAPKKKSPAKNRKR